MDLPGDAGLSMTAFTPEPGSRSDDALKLLASWAATLDDTTNRLQTADTIVATDP